MVNEEHTSSYRVVTYLCLKHGRGVLVGKKYGLIHGYGLIYRI